MDAYMPPLPATSRRRVPEGMARDVPSAPERALPVRPVADPRTPHRVEPRAPLAAVAARVGMPRYGSSALPSTIAHPGGITMTTSVCRCVTLLRLLALAAALWIGPPAPPDGPRG